MNKVVIRQIIAGTAILVMAATVNAGIFDKLKEKSKEIAGKLTAEKTNEAKNSTSNAASSASTISLGDGPDDSLVSFTKCSDLKVSNIITGYVENYTFQQGFSKEKRSGLVRREKGQATKGCILPSLQPQQSLYMEVDTKKFKAKGSSNDWKMQCVKSADPGAGVIPGLSEFPYKTSFLSGKDMMLHCGHSEKNVQECKEGTNSKRGSAWSKKLKSNGKTMLSVLAVKSTMAPSQGEKLYCQLYNIKTSESLFAFEYLRTR
ncbi:MAG: hypothetical protein JKY14_02590 [Paraglaciecola sp.]|nr:hypothetical protein [Paraglaciecola sp.]